MKVHSIAALVVLTAATALTGTVTSVAGAAPGLGSDCAVIGPVASGAVGNLSPLQSIPPAQAQVARDKYLAQLRGQEGRLTSAQGRTDMEAYIGVIQTATSPADAQRVLNAIIKLQSDCP